MSNTRNKKKSSSIWSIFTHADKLDVWFMVFGFLGSVGEGLSMPLLTFVGARLMNNAGGLSGTDDSRFFIQKINQESLNLVYLAVAVWISSFLEGYCWTRTGERQATRMRTRYLKAVLRQDISFFDIQTTSTAEIITSVSNDSLIIQNVISEKIPDFLSKIVMFVVSYIFAIVMQWRLALMACPFALLLIIPGLMCGRTLMSLARRIRAEYSKAGAIAEQAVSSVRTVYSFAGENKTLNEFSAALEGSVKLGLRQGLAKGIAIGSSGVIFAMWAFIAYYGSRMVMYHGAQGGTVYAVGALIAIGGLSLGSSLSNLKPFSEACSIGEHVMGVMKRIPKIDSESMEGEVLSNFLGEVEFRHVEFAYPSRKESLILKDFCLEIPSGKTVALVGGSGSGKSTVLALLQRFYDPLGGEIRLDGVEIGKLQLKWLRSQIGLVSQEPTLFATTIKENILFGKEDADNEEVVAAAKASNAHYFISQLPQGYDTQVGERGIQMSGGQKQRIAIARALIRAPKILLLDEATSALDSESERVVQEALDKAAVGRTTVIVAHRLSTIRKANIIAVVQNGHVIETGSHDELMENEQGGYFALVSLKQTEKSPGKHKSKTDVQSISSPRVSSVRVTSLSAKPVAGEAMSRDQKVLVPSFRRLLKMNKPEWKQAVIGCVSAVVFGAVQPVYALAMGSLISVYFSKDHNEIKSKTKIYSMVFFGLSLISIVSNVIQHYNFGYMGEYLTKRIRERILSKILTFEIGWFDQGQNSSGAICSRLAKDASIVRSLVGDRMSLLVQTVSGVTIACVMGVFIAWKLALAMIAIQPLVIATYYTRNVLLKSMSEKATKAQEQSSKLAAEAICNIRTISAFSSQNRILKWLEIAQEGPRKENIRQSWYAGIGLGISQCLAPCILAFDFWFGGKLIYEGEISSRALFETFLILVTTGRVIADAGSMTSDLAKGSEAVGSLFAILDRKTKIDPNLEDSTSDFPEKITGEVEICDVDFAYPSRPNVIVLKDFSITIESGKSTALVGPSGSGKSTIIGLIERFYDPLKGTVKIDGIDIKAYNLRSLRKQIALVSQEPALFSGTIRENIAYGAPDEVTESEIVEAAKAANAHDFISGLSDGYNTNCGDRGGQLSGGQKQRIAIARAILKNPALLLLDEATSALDSQSEKVVQAALEAVMVGRTSVVIAHRLSTVQGCDVIAVVEKGKVVEKGSHRSLLAKGPTGTYFSLVSFQGGQIT